MAAQLLGLSKEITQIREDVSGAFNEQAATHKPIADAATPPPLPTEKAGLPVGSIPAPLTRKPKPETTAHPVIASEERAKQSRSQKQASALKPAQPKKPLLERFPALEMFVGGKLITFVGILLLVTGIGFFVSYAIDHDWINEAGRTAIGLLAGGALIGAAHFLRKNYRAFSSVLIGGGIATLYFTIGYAYHEYKLFTQLIAFTLMVAVTGFAVIMSMAYNRMELAILALIGGFITPLVTKGEANNFVALFTYILILDAGMAVLAYFRNWKPLHILSLCFTVLLFGGWVVAESVGGTLPKTWAIVFATAFFVVFFVMNIANNLKRKARFQWLEYVLILANSFLYYLVGLYIVDLYKGGAYSGLFTGVVAAFHFVFAFLLYRKKSIDKNVIYILIGMVLTFVTLTAPVQLDGNHVTLFWAAEAVLLLWFGQRSNINVVKSGSFVVTLCMIISLIGQWGQAIQGITVHLAGGTQLPLEPLFANRDFIASLFAIASVMLTGHLLKREGKDEHLRLFKVDWFRWEAYRKVFPVFIVPVTYLGIFFELKMQLLSRVGIPSLAIIAVGIFSLLFVVALQVYARYTQSKSDKKQKTGFGLAAFVLSLLFLILHCTVTQQNIIAARNLYLAGQLEHSYPFLLHGITTVLALAVVWLVHKQVQVSEWLKGVRGLFTWVVAASIMFLFSAELDHLMVFGWAEDYSAISAVLHNSQKAGYPIIWGLIAFAFIFVGIKRNVLHARLAALALLGITLLKIFAFDVWEMTQIGRIVSFVSLGVLVLVTSFTYQKLAKVLFAKDAEQALETESK